jgi:mono/diheme cytochrome c family protein
MGEGRVQLSKIYHAGTGPQRQLFVILPFLCELLVLRGEKMDFREVIKNGTGRRTMKRIAALLVFLVLAAAGFLIFIYPEVHNIAASGSHFGPIRWVLETSINRSVRVHAGMIEAPPLDRYSKGEGFRHYDRLCVLCHGAPGVEPSEIGAGLLPMPPPLPAQVDHWRDAELFWIAGHGLKYTGMPAFAATNAEEHLWSIVAFLRELPTMSPEGYRSLRERLGAGPGGHAFSPEQEEEQRPTFEQEQDIIRRQAI